MTLLEMSLTGSAMIVLIIVLRALLMNHLPKRTFVCLWALALIRLMLPFSIPVHMPWAAPDPAPSAMPLPMTQVRDFARQNIPASAWPGMAAPEHAPTISQVQPWPEAPLQSVPAPLPASPIDWLAVAYFTGAALVGLYLLSAYVLLRREFKKSREMTDGPAVEIIRAQNLRRQVRVLVSGRIKSPITYGLIRPCVLLPESMAGDAAQLPYVLTHELTHIRRLDAPMKLLFAACLCMHWFNPLVWAMYILYNRDVELACDERVVRVLGTAERAGYAQLLLHMQEGRNRLTPLCNSFSRYSLKERIVSISKYKKTSALAMLLALVLIASIATGFATRAEQAPIEPPVVIEQMESFDPGADIGALFEGYKPYGAMLITTDPNETGRSYNDLIPMENNPGYGMPGNEQSDRVMDLLRGIALGEPPQDALDMQPLWRFGLSATLSSETEKDSSRDIELSLFEGTNLVMLSVTDNDNGIERRSGMRYGSLTAAQIEACEAIYEAHKPDSRIIGINGARIGAMFSERINEGTIPGVEPLAEGDRWRLYRTEPAPDIFLLQLIRVGEAAPTESLIRLNEDDILEQYLPEVAAGEAFAPPESGALLAAGSYPVYQNTTNPFLSRELRRSFEGYIQSSARLRAFDPNTGGQTSRALEGDDAHILLTALESLTLGEPPIGDLDANPLPLFTAQANLVLPDDKQRNINLLFHKDSNLVLLTVTDHSDQQLYGSVTDEQKALFMDIYQRNAPTLDEALHPVYASAPVQTKNPPAQTPTSTPEPSAGFDFTPDYINQLLIDQLGDGWIEGIAPLEGGDSWRLYNTEDSGIYLLQLKCFGKAAENIYLKLEGGVFLRYAADPFPAAGKLLFDGDVVRWDEGEWEENAIPFETPQPEPLPAIVASPSATNNPAWINPYRQYEEDEANRSDEPDPGVVHLMSMNWQDMTVSDFVDAVRAEQTAQGDNWYPVELGWGYYPADPDEGEETGFRQNPLCHALQDINGGHGGYFWRPGNPSGRDIYMNSTEQIDLGQPTLMIQGFLGFETLNPSAITVGERERILAAYYDQLYAFFLSMTPEEWLAVDPIQVLNQERDRLTAALSTPALKVRAVNFYFAYGDGAGHSYNTPGTFIDNAEVLPVQNPIATTGVRLIATDEELGIRYGELGGKGVVGPLDAWYENGWRDPATGIRHSYDPDADRRQVSIDNGATWYDEYHQRQFGGECSIFFFPESGWSFSDSQMEPYGALPITLHEALDLAPEPAAPPAPSDVAPTPGTAWLDQKWDETYYQKPDPRVVGLMNLDWRNMSVAAFNEAARLAFETEVDGVALVWQDMYGTYEDSAVTDFIFGPLQRAMIEVGDWDAQRDQLWHPGDPKGTSAFVINPGLEAYANDEPYVQVDYLLTFDTLQPDAITVGEREAMLVAYQERMSAWFNQRDMRELIQADLLPLIRAERDRLTDELSTPQLRIRAINFQARFFDGTKTYATPGDFADNMENPPTDPPVDDPKIEEIHYSSLTKIRVGTIYRHVYDEDIGETQREHTDFFVSMGGRDRPWHKDGWRDPATGLSIKFFPDLGWPLISPDNGASWWREDIPDGGSPDGSIYFECVVGNLDMANWSLYYTPTSGWGMNR